MPYKNQPPLYSTWLGMRRRCRNPNAKTWADYGGRGIKICERWESFRNFEADMGERPSKLHTLDRIDTNGDYTPDNCRWADKTEQARNTRTTRWVLVDGERYRAADLADISGQTGDVIIERAARGLPLNEVLSPSRLASHRLPIEAVRVRVANQMARTHCKAGHELNPENTYSPAPNQRLCRVCYNERKRLYEAKRRKEIRGARKPRL